MALESPVSLEELCEALQHMPNRKGFPAEFYKEGGDNIS